jgi:signal transduction histidine kinase
LHQNLIPVPIVIIKTISIEMETNNEILKKLVLLNQLQRKILFQCLHDVQSPLSAVSGYIELMHISLNGDKDLSKIERYRSKIQSGVDDISQIIEQIRYTHNKAIEEIEGGQYEVSLSWFLDDFCKNASPLAIKKGQKIIFQYEETEFYLNNNVFLLRLFLYNIIIKLLTFTPKGECITLANNRIKEGVEIIFITEKSDRSASEIVNEIMNGKSSSEPDHPKTMAHTMAILNSTINSETREEGGVNLIVKLSGI